MDKAIVARNFSRCAHLYDKYAYIQRSLARELEKELPKERYSNILEIGCGTGIFTKLLKERFGRASIVSVDIAGKMIDVAREKFKDTGINFSARDAEDMTLDREYDLITSNAAIQWFRDPETAVRKYKSAIKRGGAFIFSVFGPMTFRELDAAMSLAGVATGRSVASRGFLTKEEIAGILAKNFRKSAVRRAIITEEYPSLARLLETIKYTGVRGPGSAGSSEKRFSWTRKILREVEAAYKKSSGRIIATYEVLLCKAVK